MLLLLPAGWIVQDYGWMPVNWIGRAVTGGIKANTKKHAEIQGSAHGYPYLKIDQQNGHSVMRYPGINDAYHSFDEISNIRTAFWVISKSENSWGMLLGNSSASFHFTAIIQSFIINIPCPP